MELRQAAGNALALVDVAGVLEETRSQRLEAESRAEIAEATAAALGREIADLKDQKEDLERQVAVLSATAAM